MGLDLTYGERRVYDSETDKESPNFSAHDKPVQANCRGKTDGEYSCDGCPLECDPHYAGCQPSMGSYTYVASLHDFCQEAAPHLLDNAFVLATKGGGFRPTFKLSDVKGFEGDWHWLETDPDTTVRTEKPSGALLEMLLRDAEALRKELDALTSDAVVVYDKEGAEKANWGASLARSTFGLSWRASSQAAGRIGVHYGEGICLVDAGGRYLKETKDARIIDVLLPRGKKYEEGDLAVFQKVPALPRFEHLIDTFKRIAEIALAHGLSVEGC